jgi:cytochrome c oxidase subunit 3
MVGLHGLHVLIGVVLIGIYGGLALRGRYSRYRYMPIEVLGLYWHFVDLIWVFLYPLFYLIDRG